MEGGSAGKNEAEGTVSEILCIPAARQPDGSVHRGPYILIRNTAAAQTIHWHVHTQTHKMLAGVRAQMAAGLLAVGEHASGGGG